MSCLPSEMSDIGELLFVCLSVCWQVISYQLFVVCLFVCLFASTQAIKSLYCFTALFAITGTLSRDRECQYEVQRSLCFSLIDAAVVSRFVFVFCEIR